MIANKAAAFGLLVLGTGLFSAAPRVAFGQDSIVLHVGTLIDGKGGVQRNTYVVVKGSKIEKVGAPRSRPGN